MLRAKIDYDAGLARVRACCPRTAAEYLLALRDVFVQDTPFGYYDIRELHREMQRRDGEAFYFRWVTLRSELNRLRRMGLIAVLDEDGGWLAQRSLMWAAYYRAHAASCPRAEGPGAPLAAAVVEARRALGI